MAISKSTPRKMSVEDYLALDNAAIDTKYEYFDGYAVEWGTDFAPERPKGWPRHGAICALAISALVVALRDQPYRVYTADVRAQIAADRYVYPDVTVSPVATDQRIADGIKSPRVVIEVLSSNTERADRGSKFHDYRACPSIQEYMLINTEKPLIEVFQRADGFMYYYAYEIGDVLELTSLGLRIPVAEIYRGIEFPLEPDAIEPG